MVIYQKEERVAQGQQGQNAGMQSAGRGGFRRRNGGIGAEAEARRRVLRTQDMGSAAAEKVAGEGKRRDQGRGNSSSETSLYAVPNRQ